MGRDVRGKHAIVVVNSESNGRLSGCNNEAEGRESWEGGEGGESSKRREREGKEGRRRGRKYSLLMQISSLEIKKAIASMSLGTGETGRKRRRTFPN